MEVKLLVRSISKLAQSDGSRLAHNAVRAKLQSRAASDVTGEVMLPESRCVCVWPKDAVLGFVKTIEFTKYVASQLGVEFVGVIENQVFTYFHQSAVPATFSAIISFSPSTY